MNGYPDETNNVRYPTSEDSSVDAISNESDSQLDDFLVVSTESVGYEGDASGESTGPDNECTYDAFNVVLDGTRDTLRASTDSAVKDVVVGGTRDTLRANGGGMGTADGIRGIHTLMSLGGTRDTLRVCGGGVGFLERRASRNNYTSLGDRDQFRFVDDRVEIGGRMLVNEMGWLMWYLVVIDVLSSVLVWWIASFLMMSEHYERGIRGACEAVEGGGTYTVLSVPMASNEAQVEQMQVGNTNRTSDGSSGEREEEVSRDEIQNKQDFNSNLDHSVDSGSN